MHNFKELNVWKYSMDFVIEVYNQTQFLPENERFGLQSQIRRAAISIPSNIAEGCGKNSNKAFCNSLRIALGESFEIETQIELAARLSLIPRERTEVLNANIKTIQQMLFKLIQFYEAKSSELPDT